MKLLRRRVRRSFLFATIGFLILGLLDLTRQDYAAHGISTLHHFGFVVFCLAQGGIYAAAWFTTKKPSPYRNNWALLGSLLTLAWAGFDLWLHHADILAARGGIVGLILAVAGLYVFGQGGAPPRSASQADTSSETTPPPLEPALQASYQAGFVTPDERITRVYRVPATEGSASSAAIAAAAASPEAPIAPAWDPVRLIRGASGK
ncbi:MAG TPA: hypothetical protein VN612_02125 [Acidobacteriaceae bacterium]|nr:hypothetical protein [Acidobacteriaceae bacterium]